MGYRETFRNKVEIFKALSHPARLEIAERLSEREHCACEIAEWFRLDRTTVSKHLAVLKQSGVLSDRRDGHNIYYSLRLACLVPMMRCMESSIDESTEPATGGCLSEKDTDTGNGMRQVYETCGDCGTGRP